MQGCPGCGSPSKKLLCLFCRLNHRNYLLESPHKFSVTDLQQVGMSCFPWASLEGGFIPREIRKENE